MKNLNKTKRKLKDPKEEFGINKKELEKFLREATIKSLMNHLSEKERKEFIEKVSNDEKEKNQKYPKWIHDVVKKLK